MNPFASLFRGRRPSCRRTRRTRLSLEHLESRTLLAAGALDPTFGPGGTEGDGVKVLTFNLTGSSFDDRANAVAIDSLGRIVMAGYANFSGNDDDFAVLRLNAADGSLDTTFGTGGKVTFGFDVGGDQTDRAQAVVIDSQGRIVVAGFAQRNNSGNNDFAIARLLDNGSLDTSFDGDGLAVVNFNTGTNLSDDRAKAVAIDSQGRIVVAGYGQSSGQTDDDFAVARLTTNGALDDSFSNDGRMFIGYGIGSPFNDRANGLAIDSQDRIVVAGYATFSGDDTDFAVARVTTGGVLDDTFDSDGKATIAFDIGDDRADAAQDVKIDSSGRIVLGGYAQADSDNPNDIKFLFAAARLLSNGMPDTAFSNDGQTTFDLLLGNNDHRAFGLALAPQGRIILVGRADLGPTSNDFGVVRVNSDGSANGAFGPPGPNGQVGQATIEIANAGGIGDDDQATAVAIDAQGRIVVAGYTQTSGTNYNFAVARLEADTLQWSPDTTYSVGENGGTVTLTVTRASGTTGTVTVEYTTNDGTATDGADYSSRAGTLTFGDGVTSRTLTVPILNDSIFEGNEAFTVTLSGATRALIAGGSTATVTITDNDPAPVVAFSSATYSVNEGGGSVTITVNRTGSDGAFTVPFATSNGSATAGQDYAATTGTLTFGVSQASRTFTIPITDDGIFEGDETVNLALGTPTGAVLGTQSSAVLSIVENDIGIGSISGLVFNDLNGGGGTAPEAGEPRLSGWTVYLDINNNEQLDVGEPSALTNASGNYSFSSLPIDTYIVREVLQAGWIERTPADWFRTVTLTTAAPSVTSAHFANWLRTSISGVVFNDLNGNGNRDAGEPGIPNATVFIDENENPDNFSPIPGTATGSDGPFLDNYPRAIPDVATIRVNNNVTAQRGAVVDLNFTLNIDHTFDSNLTVFLISPIGTRVQLFSGVGGDRDGFTITLDDEAATSITSVAATGGRVTGTFQPAQSLSAFDGQESSGTWRLEVTDTATGDTGALNSWSQSFTFQERTAVTDASGNYTISGLPVPPLGTYMVVRAAIPSGWVETSPKNRGAYKGIPISGGNSTGHNFGLFQRGSISGVVFNDVNTDGVRQVATEPGLSGQTVFLDQNGNGVPDANTVLIQPPRGFQPTTINDQTSIRLRLPVSGIAGVLTDVNVNLDISHTYDSDLRLTLISPLGTSVVLFNGVGGFGDNFIGTTIDDEAATTIGSGSAPFTGSFKPQNPLSAFDGQDPTGAWFLKIEDTTAADSGTLNTFTLTLTYAEATTTTVAGGAYSFTGVTPGLYTVRTLPPAGFVVTAPTVGFQSVPFFSGDVLTGVDLGIAASVGGTLQFSAASYSVNESAGVVTITVTRTDNLLGAIAVQYTTTPATAVHGSDFSPQIGLLNFATGQSSAGFTVPIVNDTINEGSETFTVSLFTPLGGAVLGSPSTATVTILDDDPVQTGSISGAKFSDRSGDGIRQPATEPGLPGWTIFLDQNSNAVRDSVAASFASTNVPLAIPDAASIYSTLNVHGVAGTITDLNVTLSLTHTYDSDLEIYLISPLGTRIRLVNRAGADGDDFTGVLLDDEAVTPIASGLAPFSGTFQPDQALSALDGQELSGTWRLEIDDVAGEDVGNLTAWSLGFTYLERAVVTDAVGNYSLGNLTPGTYTVREVQQAAWVQTGPAGGLYTVPLAVGQNVGGQDFGNQPTTLFVTAFASTPTGFTATFNKALFTTDLNLYDTQAGTRGPADVTLTGAVSGTIRGSLVLNAAGDAITFVRTGGLLPANDAYTVTFRSAANGFHALTGGLLDGNIDNVAGDDYTTTFAVLPSTAVVVSVPEFARGPGQAVDVPATSAGLPLRLSNGDGIRTARIALQYNPALLTSITGTRGPNTPADAVVTVDTSVFGQAVIDYSSATALAPGAVDLVLLTATVPLTAPYASKQVLNITSILLNNGDLLGLDDDGLHVVAYPGDTSGGARYSSLDATQALRVAVGFDGGFFAYPLADPRVIADLNGNGRVDSTDATTILKETVGIDQLAIPALPVNAPVITVLGPDPLLQFPRNLKGQPGDTFTVPLRLSPSDGLEAADLAIGYDTTRLEVVAVERGELTADFDLFWSNLDAVAGTLRVGLGRTEGPIADRGVGSVLQITFRVRPDAPAGRAIVNLRANVGSTRTSLNEGGLDLIPKPSNKAGDALDGEITVRRAPRLIEPRGLQADAVTAVFRAADLAPDLVSAVLALDARTLQKKFSPQR